jgi:hypothetical protein
MSCTTCHRHAAVMAISRIALLSALVLPVLVALAPHAAAQEPRPRRDVNVTTAVDGDLLRAGRHVNVQGQVAGDVAVAGSRVSIAAPVDGYVMAAGDDVGIQGSIGDDLWAAGRRVELGAPVADNARLAGESVFVQPQAAIGHDALIAGRHVEVRGPVQHDLTIGAAEALIASEIGGSVRARAGSLKLLPGAVVRGDLVAYGPNPPDIAPGAQVLGQVRYRAPWDAAGASDWSVLGFVWQWMFGFVDLTAILLTQRALDSPTPGPVYVGFERAAGLR